MEITIGSYKMRVEILLLIIVLFWVAFGHLLCGCCKVSLFEGATTMSGDFKRYPKIEKAQKELDDTKDRLARVKSEVSNLESKLETGKSWVEIMEKSVVLAEEKLIEAKNRVLAMNEAKNRALAMNKI